MHIKYTSMFRCLGLLLSLFISVLVGRSSLGLASQADVPPRLQCRLQAVSERIKQRRDQATQRAQQDAAEDAAVRKQKTEERVKAIRTRLAERKICQPVTTPSFVPKPTPEQIRSSRRCLHAGPCRTPPRSCGSCGDSPCPSPSCLYCAGQGYWGNCQQSDYDRR